MSETIDYGIQARVAAIGAQFAIKGNFYSVEEIPNGHINSTYRVTYQELDGTLRRYILQAINSRVFTDPTAVMRNVVSITEHINTRVLRLQKDLGGQTLQLFPARTGGSWIEDETGNLWRCYNYIEGCITYDIAETTQQAYQAAHAFGAFQDLVSDLNPATITETIPDFHNTRKRFEKLLEVAAEDPLSRLAGVRDEYHFVLARENLIDILLDLTATGEIPIRITHNDTKINNVMIDAASDEAVCVIDLDTVMPGLALYDFGDLVRSATSPAAEDEKDLSKVTMRLPMFEALVAGYLDAAGSFLNETEVAHLVHSGKLLALEVAIRFLTDHLAGDVYFRIHRPGQNLDRCRTQLRLIESIEAQEPEMQAIVKKLHRARHST